MLKNIGFGGKFFAFEGSWEEVISLAITAAALSTIDWGLSNTRQYAEQPITRVKNVPTLIFGCSVASLEPGVNEQETPGQFFNKNPAYHLHFAITPDIV
jgi:hypothetical protein